MKYSYLKLNLIEYYNANEKRLKARSKNDILKLKSYETFNNKYCYGVEKQIFHMEYFITTTKMYLRFQCFCFVICWANKVAIMCCYRFRNTLQNKKFFLI